MAELSVGGGYRRNERLVYAATLAVVAAMLGNACGDSARDEDEGGEAGGGPRGGAAGRGRGGNGTGGNATGGGELGGVGNGATSGAAGAPGASGEGNGGSSGTSGGGGTGGTPPVVCGDGALGEGEECEDGNTDDGDGCSSRCELECRPEDEPCTAAACGDGILAAGEECDDRNVRSEDGCSASCRIEPGWVCPDPGSACERVPTCGDGVIGVGESCDDANTTSGDGCSGLCAIEIGHDCSGQPSVCRATLCGDGVREGAESCDDRNTYPFDGCAPNCQLEPTCSAGPGCTSPCGDGIVFGAEQCDDGNSRAGDGCSATCTVEPGFTCSNALPCQMLNGTCTQSLPVIFRDFNRAGVAGGHPDFQPLAINQTVIPGLVQPELDGEGKPVLSSTASVANGFMHGQSAFAQWYRNGAPAGPPIPSTLRLWASDSGRFVNRWGQNGEPWRGYPAIDPDTGAAVPLAQYCGDTCAACMVAPGPGQVCLEDCFPHLATYACTAFEYLYDGNPLFFPIDNAPGVLADTRSPGKVPEQYGWNGWPAETDVAARLGVAAPIVTSAAPFPSATHNFHFTTEMRFWFRYDSSIQWLEFTGDDDAWVFVNGRLALDLGGWHVPVGRTVPLDGSAAEPYGLTIGNLYEIAVFHAERQTDGSSFRLALGNLSTERSVCVPR